MPHLQHGQRSRKTRLQPEIRQHWHHWNRAFLHSIIGKPRDYLGEFQLASAFDRHIIERHERIFQSMNSSEFICLLCPCDSIAHDAIQCTARFSTTSGKQGFLDHLRTCHAGDPDNRIWWQHLCAPNTTASYHPALRKVADFHHEFSH